MSSEDWPEVRLGDCVDLQTGFPFKSARFTDDPLDVRLVRGDNIVQGRFRWEGVRRWLRTDLDAYDEYSLEPGDVILAMDRPWIEAGLKYAAVSAEDLPCLLVQRVSRMRGRNGLSTRFLRYVIGSPSFTEHVLAVQTGTAVPHISGRQIADYRFRLPPLVEQERIAGLLGALDDKIELNRRKNRTLEAMARAIFRSWFVDITSPRGQVGGGESVCRSGEWPEIAFGDTVQILSGGTPRTSEPAFWGGEVAWYSVADAPTDADVFVVQTQKSITDAGLENSAAQIVPALTTIISARGTVGTCAMTAQPMAFNQSCFGLRPHDGLGIYYTYFSTLTVVDALRRSAHGSVFSTITRDTFRSVTVRKPPRQLVEAFERAAEPLMNGVLLNVRETRHLVGILDALLPRLMSGELRHNVPTGRPGKADA